MAARRDTRPHCRRPRRPGRRYAPRRPPPPLHAAVPDGQAETSNRRTAGGEAAGEARPGLARRHQGHCQVRTCTNCMAAWHGPLHCDMGGPFRIKLYGCMGPSTVAFAAAPCTHTKAATLSPPPSIFGDHRLSRPPPPPMHLKESESFPPAHKVIPLILPPPGIQRSWGPWGGPTSGWTRAWPLYWERKGALLPGDVVL